ncbi:DNA repair protein REV1 [Corylus avellana]|uniref:DNA repair protein REV1 n=1 Tax=Corylus avellana TaxID=13451 RepID=UPI00286C8405|nr:DNA repair protein REV1 [Corylus avellana]
MSLDLSRSANSSGSQRSKRGFNNNNNSTSSNRSSNSNDSNKKKKVSQKTLGVAWGANSISSSRSSSFRKSPFSDFGSYMVEKNRKLQNQFDVEASASSHSDSGSGKPIFHGVSIFVDGFTVPSSQELRGYMLKHGGRLENYFSRRRVTHIICSNLPDSKIKNLRSFSGGLPVVKPMWILDSVAANKLLSWVPYQLDQLANNQPKLSAFFALKSSPQSQDALPCAPVCPGNPEAEDSSFKGGTSVDASFSDVGEPVEHSGLISGESNNLMNKNSNVSLLEEPASSCGKPSEVTMTKPSNFDVEDESSVRNELQSSHYQPSALVSSNFMDIHNMKGSPSSTVGGPSNQHHSTLEDPNFVENYFKNSRLHFIGTWRNRYRKRFPSFSNGFKFTSSNTKASAPKTAVIHVDMDCFFVSVVIRSHPEMQDKPVAVCHSDNPKGTAEISSANYPARDYGVRAGMFVRDAKALCPHLVIFPYNFEAYEEVADQFYNILHKHCNKVQAVSCDEAFLDVTDTDTEGDPQLLASTIRKEILETTGCTASAGIAENMLMARLATRTAKPDGQCCIPPERADDYLSQLPIKALPGIGHVLEEKLKKQNVWTCGQLRMISKDSLQKDFGTKTGEMLWNYSRGVDNRLVGVIQESKSIGAEVNWGVRFKDVKDCQNFLSNLCKEVSLRLQGCGVKGRTFTLKIKKRRKDAEEPAKYMGCGECENLSHSTTVPVATDDVEVLQRISKQLFGTFHLDVKEIRGLGLQVSRLESADNSKQAFERNSLKSWLISASASTKELWSNDSTAKDRFNIGQGDGVSGQTCANSVGLSIEMDNNMSDSEACLNQVSELPPLCHLDMGVLESLPPELFSELNEIYGRKLVDLIAKNKGKSVSISGSSSTHSHARVEGAMNEGQAVLLFDPVLHNEIPVEKKHISEEVPAVLVSGAESYSVAIPASCLEKTDLMPSSLSQVDVTVLQQLPEELKADILEVLPAHRRQDVSSNVLSEVPLESKGIKTTENHSGSKDSVLDNNLWAGTPPQWVDKFKVSNCLILNILAEMYYEAGSTGNLSPILQRAISVPKHQLDASQDGWDEAAHILRELLKQYIKLKIEFDIEEIYVCFCLLKRFAMKSELFLHVYTDVFPYLQASFGENYGGNLHISLKD